MTAWGIPLTRSHALLTAFALALLLGWRTTVREYSAGGTGGDFGQFRNVARALLDGQNPYDRDSVPPYPLPSLLIVAPLSTLRHQLVPVFLLDWASSPSCTDCFVALAGQAW